MIDIAIVGTGPAGLSAGINTVIRNKKTIVFGNRPENSYLYKAEKVNNYLGLYGLNGKEIIDIFLKHAYDMGVEIKYSKVQEIFDMGDYYTLNVNNEFYEAKKVIIAVGIPKSNYFKGEKQYIGKGISYCATCDGSLYAKKVVAVIGETKEAEEDVIYLSEICKKVYYIPNYKCSSIFSSNVQILYGNIIELNGTDIIHSINIDNTKLDVDGIFLVRKNIPIEKLISGLETENNYIKVNRYMETNFNGIYAAGDCTGKPLQISKAVGEGLIAAQMASKN